MTRTVDWSALAGGISIVSSPNDVPKPTLEDCTEAEASLGITLPSSYKEFITVFGAGDLAKEFQLFAPNCPNMRYDLVSVNRDVREQLVKDNLAENYSDDPAQTLRLVIFARNFDSDEFGWDSAQVTLSKESEYKVYLLPRLLGANEYYTDTFEEFVLELCLGELYCKYRNVESWDLGGERRVFEPAEA